MCHQVAVWFPRMFRNFYLVKNHRVGSNLTSTEAREEISADLETLKLKQIDMCMTKLKTINCYFLKLAAYLQGHPSYLQGETSPFKIQIISLSYFPHSEALILQPLLQVVGNPLSIY